MKTRNTLTTLLILAAIVATCLAPACQRQPIPIPSPIVTPLVPPDQMTSPPDEVVALGMTHLTGLQIQGSETDALVVDQQSTGDIVEFRDNGSSVFRIADGGAVTIAGDVSLTGDVTHTGDETFTGDQTIDGTLTVNGDITLENDETLSNATNGSITATVASDGFLWVSTGNLRVGDETPDGTLNGEDAYIEGFLEVDGAADFDSTADFASTVAIAGNISDGDSAVTIADNAMVDGAADAVQLTVQGHSTQSSNPDLLVVETSAGTDLFAVNNSGVVDIDGSVTVDQTGTGSQVYSTITSNGTTSARALRGKAQGTSGTTGDLVGVYGIATVDTTATVQDASTIAASMNWAEVLKASGTVTVCATGGGCVFAAERNIVELAQDMTGVSGRASAISYNEAWNNAAGGDLHYGVFVLNNQQTGNGDIGAAFAAESGDWNADGGADFDYILDANNAVIDSGGAEIRGTNGETLSNATDTTWVIGGFTTAAEQTAEVVTSGSTIVATGTYQPITSATALTTSATTAIADGVVNGQILVLVNENASDAITIKNGANTHLTADVALGNDDTLTLMWDGADWLEIATSDNS